MPPSWESHNGGMACAHSGSVVTVWRLGWEAWALGCVLLFTAPLLAPLACLLAYQVAVCSACGAEIDS